MKRPIFIVLSVIGIFILLSFALMRMMSPRIGNTFNTISNALPGGYGGGSPEFGIAPMEEPAAPAPEFDLAASDIAKSEEFYSAQGQTQERMVIENADLAIVVQDPRTRMTQINAMANEMGGYVVSSSLSQSFTSGGKEVPEAYIVIRVPSERLDEALERIKDGAVDVQYENRSGQDVTNIYVDLQSQLRAKEAAEEQLLEILDRAETAEDVLAIYLQLQSVQSEIEVLKGQIKYYEEAAALSSVSVRLIAEESTQPIEIGPWTPQGAAKDAVEDLIRFAQNFAEFLIYFVISVVPSLILIAIPLYLLFLGGRGLYRRFNRSKAVVEEEKK